MANPDVKVNQVNRYRLHLVCGVKVEIQFTIEEILELRKLMTDNKTTLITVGNCGAFVVSTHITYVELFN